MVGISVAVGSDGEMTRLGPILGDLLFMFRQGVHDPKSLFDDSGKNILLKDAKVSLCIDNELGTEKLNERVCGHEQNIPDTCLQQR